jgi:hypothetical protein
MNGLTAVRVVDFSDQIAARTARSYSSTQGPRSSRSSRHKATLYGAGRRPAPRLPPLRLGGITVAGIGVVSVLVKLL